MKLKKRMLTRAFPTEISFSRTNVFTFDYENIITVNTEHFLKQTLKIIFLYKKKYIGLVNFNPQFLNVVKFKKKIRNYSAKSLKGFEGLDNIIMNNDLLIVFVNDFNEFACEKLFERSFLYKRPVIAFKTYGKKGDTLININKSFSEGFVKLEKLNPVLASLIF